MEVILIEAKLSHDIILPKELFFYHDYNILSLKKKTWFHELSMQ